MDIVLPEDPVIPLLDMYSKDAPTHNNDTCSTMFIAALFIIARNWKKSFNRGMDAKIWYIYTVEYYLALKNNDFMKSASKWMELEIIILNEVK